MTRRFIRHARQLRTPAVLALIAMLPACSPPQHVEEESSPPPPASPAPSLATPAPSPTPLYVPYKKLDTGKLFNGIQFQASLAAEPGRAATIEAADPSSYSLRLELRVRVPKAVSTPDALTALNPALPALFPAFPQWIQSARVSPLYERFYRFKLQSLQQNLVRLDQLLTRHDFFDCETILEIQAHDTHRRALWLQSDMDVDSDGSDSDRVPKIDGSSPTFQPITSYKWPKRTAAPNPFLGLARERLRLLEGGGSPKTAAARDLAGQIKWEIGQLTNKSFLIGATDPYVVMSSAVEGQRDNPFSPFVGDYCAVIYGNVIYPAIVGDVGPANKMGEASLRIAQEINALATAENRPVSALKVTYLVFPGTAEHPFRPPDLAHWRDKIDGYLKEMGGWSGELFTWKDLTAPTPTPTPSPTPAPAASASPSSAASPSPAASASPTATSTPSAP